MDHVSAIRPAPIPLPGMNFQVDDPSARCMSMAVTSLMTGEDAVLQKVATAHLLGEPLSAQEGQLAMRVTLKALATGEDPSAAQRLAQLHGMGARATSGDLERAMRLALMALSQNVRGATDRLCQVMAIGGELCVDDAQHCLRVVMHDAVVGHATGLDRFKFLIGLGIKPDAEIQDKCMLFALMEMMVGTQDAREIVETFASAGVQASAKTLDNIRHNAAEAHAAGDANGTEVLDVVERLQRGWNTVPAVQPMLA